MFRDDERTLYFKGNLVFAEEPDWDLLAKGVELLNRHNRNYRGRPLEVRRATVDENDVYRVPFISEASLELSRREGRERIELTHEEALESFFEELVDYLGTFFGCEVETTVLEPGFACPEDLETVMDMFESGKRARGIFGREPLCADDLRPEDIAIKGGDPLTELDALVGLDVVKAQVHDIVSLVRNHGRDKLPCLHMVFRGNPGTGKTTVARLIGRIFDEEGVTDGKGTFVETDRGGLCGMYVGHTAAKTRKTIDDAKGGVLFIDEAYALGMSDSGRDYGPEAIATLVKAMEDSRDDFVCILAGYTEPMDRMIDVNPGLRDRIAFYIDFPDYSATELVDIFRLCADADGFCLSADAKALVEDTMAALVANKDDNFSNARIVRKVYERIRLAHMVSSTGETIRVESVEKALADTDIAKLIALPSTNTMMGFC